MFDLLNIFEVFLPQLLRYPNAADPLNGQAAQLLLRDEVRYNARVKEYIRRHASNPNPVVVETTFVTSVQDSSKMHASVSSQVTLTPSASSADSPAEGTDDGATSRSCSLSAGDLPTPNGHKCTTPEAENMHEDMLWESLSDVSGKK